MKSEELSKAYDPSSIEEKRYAAWEKANYFTASPHDPRPSFTIVIPPPNVTGVLHMGHALDNTLQDILIRYKRMSGFASLWVPGTDHAGIATQNVVERELAKEKTTRQKLGREKFVERVWKWKEASGGKIVHQLRRLGASCDWSRERFTMDEGLSRAVRKVFVDLYHEGLIYRSSYLISWCPRCQTALSDLEVDYFEVNGELTQFDYETADGKRITVATTRPETMLGDTAIAVHPDDKRYKSWIGQKAKHPFLPREIPIIADAAVDPKFGTGAVKVTPAHDPVDYEMGKRHQLSFITVIDEEGKMTAEAGAYKGLDRFEARKKVTADLKKVGLLKKVEPYRHSVGHCQRCRTIIEPRISEQWFVKIAPLAKPAIEAVKNGKTIFVPESWTKTYLNWMENIRDWCISRQLWWGHQIPVWYCGDCREKTVSMEDPTQCGHCKSKNLTRDPDVLDTWFSSALWPFSTLGWPEATADLKHFYPTSVLVTGFDIIFFWVARMMMMGLKFMNDVPFRIVHIHALVRDEKGQKMSKSKGNVVDPLEIMERYGTDAFRFALASFAIQGRDILLSEKRIEGYRNFINKLWNAARFALNTESPSMASSAKTLPDRWIRHRINEVTSEVRRALDELKFNEAAESLYRFIWHELCDWYLELIKSHRGESQSTLIEVLDRILRLLHPLAPFVTEEIWQRLPIEHSQPSIVISDYPVDDGFRDKEALTSFTMIESSVNAIRQIRSENRIKPAVKFEAQVRLVEGKSSRSLELAKEQAKYIEILAGLSHLNCAPGKRPQPAAIANAGDLEIVVPLEGLFDTSSERDRLEKEKRKFTEDVAFLEKRLADPKYRSKAPSHLIEKDEAKLADVRLHLEKIERTLDSLK